MSTRHLPGSDEYIGRCTGCRRKYCWPKTERTSHVQNGAGGRQFRCPGCGRGAVIQTSRMNAGPRDFEHLHEHQAANLQTLARV